MDVTKLSTCCDDLFTVLQKTEPIHRVYPDDIYVKDSDGDKWLFHYCPFCGAKRAKEERAA